MSTAEQHESLEGELIDEVEFVNDYKALSVQTRAEIDIQIATAKRYPRELSVFKKRCAEMACSDRETAEKMFYKLKRGGKTIEGPSVRLAEIVSGNWGNLRTSVRVLEVEDDFVVAQGMCHDLETNNATALEVRRRILDKHGNRYNADMIGVTSMAAASIAYRNVVFKIVPFSYVQEFFNECKKLTAGDRQSFKDFRKEIFDDASELGITKAMIVNFCEVSDVADLTSDHLIDVRGVMNAINEGQTTVDQQFDADVSTGRRRGRATESSIGKPKEQPTELEEWQQRFLTSLALADTADEVDELARAKLAIGLDDDRERWVIDAADQRKQQIDQQNGELPLK